MALPTDGWVPAQHADIVFIPLPAPEVFTYTDGWEPGAEGSELPVRAPSVGGAEATAYGTLDSSWASFIVRATIIIDSIYSAVLLDSISYPEAPSRPCVLEGTLYRGDRETIDWQVSSDRGWIGESGQAIPHLQEPTHYGEQVIDVANGSAKISQVAVNIIDPPTLPGDQDSGLMTRRLADEFGISNIKGYRFRLRRWINEIAGWVTIGDGPAGAPDMNRDFSSFRFPIRDSRDWERKLRIVASAETSLLPAGPVNGFGRYDGDQYLIQPVGFITGEFRNNPTGPGGLILHTGNWDPAFNTPDGGDGAFPQSHWIKGAPPADIYGPIVIATQGVVASNLFSNRIESVGLGTFDWHTPEENETYLNIPLYTHYWDNILIRWRKAGETEWRYMSPPPLTIPRSDPVSLLDGDWNMEHVDPIYGVVSDTPAYGQGTIQGMEPERGMGLLALPMPLRWDTFMEEDVLSFGDNIEYNILWVGEASEDLPAYIEGMTFGEFVRDVYLGLYSPRDSTGAPIPTGIRFNEEAVLGMVDPVRMRLKAPIKNARDFLEKEGYKAVGYVPAFDNEMAISPKNQRVPTSRSELEALTIITNDVSVPSPNWGHGDRIINVLSFTYKRLYPDISSPSLDGIREQEVTLEYRNAESIRRNGEQDVEIETNLFSALSDEDGAPLEAVELGTRLAFDRRDSLFDVYKFGTPTFQLEVFRIASFHLRPGDFARVNISWFPEYSTQRRGMDVLARIIGIADLNCSIRHITFESCGSWPTS